MSRADNEVNNELVKLNDKVTLGVYDQLTPNLMLLAEGTTMWSKRSKNQVGDENKAWVANVGRIRFVLIAQYWKFLLHERASQ